MSLIGRTAAQLIMMFAVVPSLFAGTLVGRVYSDQGRPVDGVLVSVQPTQMTPAGLPRQQSITDAQGKFTFEVADGQYSVCVFSDYKGLLNSCEWSLDESVVTVQPPLTQFKIALKSGVAIRIRLNDASQLVSNLNPQSDASVHFIAWDSLEHSHYFREVGSDNKGKNLELLVPRDASLRLAVQSRNVDVVDITGLKASQTSVAMVSAVSALGDTRVYQVLPASVGADKAGK